MQNFQNMQMPNMGAFPNLQPMNMAAMQFQGNNGNNFNFQAARFNQQQPN